MVFYWIHIYNLHKQFYKLSLVLHNPYFLLLNFEYHYISNKESWRIWFSQWWCSKNPSILCHKDLKEESRLTIKRLLASTLQIEAQASRDDLDTEYLYTKYEAESKDKDVVYYRF